MPEIIARKPPALLPKGRPRISDYWCGRLRALVIGGQGYDAVTDRNIQFPNGSAGRYLLHPGYSLYLDRAAFQYGVLPGNDGSTEVTYFGLVRASAAADINQGIFSLINDSNSHRSLVYIGTGGQLISYRNNGGANEAISPPGTILAGEVTAIAVRSSKDFSDVWKDGKKVASSSVSVPMSGGFSRGIIGGYLDTAGVPNGAFYFGGDVILAAVINNVVSDKELTSLFKNPASLFSDKSGLYGFAQSFGLSLNSLTMSAFTASGARATVGLTR